MHLGLLMYQHSVLSFQPSALLSTPVIAGSLQDVQALVDQQSSNMSRTSVHCVLQMFTTVDFSFQLLEVNIVFQLLKVNIVDLD